MAETFTIPKEKSSEPSLNYELLRREGLQHIESLSGRIWTDYNTHDPGITMLELLCYAITDLGYRISLPLKDLLAGPADNAALMSAQFPGARTILPMAPLTIRDYRKLLIDCPGVKNAWLTLRESAEVPIYLGWCGERLTAKEDLAQKNLAIQGFYDVLLDLEDEKTSQSAKIIEAVRARLMKNRNLCEDFLDVALVAEQNYILCAEIDIEATADVDAVEAEIFWNLQNYLTPDVKFYSLQDMLDRKAPVEDIFTGPVLDHGFIDNQELEQANLPETIPLSDVIRIVMDVQGVKAIREIRLACQTPCGESIVFGDTWNQEIPENTKVILNPDKSRLVYYKGHVPLLASHANVSARLLALNEERKKQKKKRADDLPVPEGDFRATGEYETIANEFPFTYGIGQNGLPDNASGERQAQAKQLKAYLLFFDQVLAGYFAQLAHVRDLFSFDPSIKKTYFTQTVDGLKGSHELYANLSSFADNLQAMTEDEDLFIRRRNRFLDHLLARFAENFSEYTAILFSLYRDLGEDAAIRAKALFLGDYSAASSRRALGFDYTDKVNLWDTDQVSGLERRLARLLGIENFKRRNLSDIKYDIYEEKDTDKILEYRFRVVDEINGKILLSSRTKYKQKEKAIEEMRLALNRALTREGFELKETVEADKKRYYFNIVTEKGAVLARRIEYFKSAEKRQEAIDYLVAFLMQRYSDEGFFLIEHPLLRPRAEADAIMPVCADAADDDPFAWDPYSFRLTFVLPAYSPRFANMTFRLHVEQTIRLETPAHLLPRICWISKAQMGIFEDAYHQWLTASAKSQDKKRSDTLKQLIDALSTNKNVYEPATLYDCSHPEEQKNPFILDYTILGEKE